eukprot:27681_1
MLVRLFLFWCFQFLTWNIHSNTYAHSEEHFQYIDIPSIDISSFISGDNITRSNIINLFDYAFNEFGIIRIINHNIPSNLMGNIFNEMSNFFHESYDTKMQYNLGEFGAPGYIPKFKESFYINPTNGQKQTEPTESFHIVSNYTDSFSMQRGIPYFPFNSDNGLPIHFTHTNIYLYYSLLRQLLHTIHQIASIALGYKENIFELKMNKNSFLGLRMTYYYELNETSTSRQNNGHYLRLNEHIDFAGFALIQNDKRFADGFQIKYNNIFYNIEAVNDSILILGGDFIRFFTNNYWKSLRHRVLTKSGEERFTMIGFSGTDLNEVIDILPNCYKCNVENRKFNPINGQEWILKRVFHANAVNDVVNSGNDVNDVCKTTN